MSEPKFNNGQLRGAYRAGYEAGFQDGRDALRREGWRKIRPGEVLKAGATVKALAESVCGWKGQGRVIHATEDEVEFVKLTNVTDAELEDDECFRTAIYCPWQVLVLDDASNTPGDLL